MRDTIARLMSRVCEYYSAHDMESARYIDKLVRQSRDYAEMKTADRAEYEKLVATMEKLYFDPNAKPSDPASPPFKPLHQIWAELLNEIAALKVEIAACRELIKSMEDEK